jgi:phosphoserine aminotransferase
MEFSTNNKNYFKTPSAVIMEEYINMFLWMDGEFKEIDARNEEEGEFIDEDLEQSYFIWNAFNNFGFD